MKMEKPTVEAVRFNDTDVIATSGYPNLTIGGTYDGVNGGTINGISYDTAEAAANAINSMYQISSDQWSMVFVPYGKETGNSLTEMFGDWVIGQGYANEANGEYKYEGKGAYNSYYWYHVSP